MFGYNDTDNDEHGGGLIRDASQPLYSQLAKEIRTKIQSGQWPDGTKLPPERTLCSMYDVSRITVRHAISQLENEGLVSRLQGLGTFVTDKKYEQPLAEIHSFTLAMQKLGYTASTRVHKTGSLVGDLLLANILGTASNETLFTLQLIGLGDSQPIVFYESYFNSELGSRMLQASSEMALTDRAFSTLDLYREHLGMHPRTADQTFESTVADSELAMILEIQAGAPILKVTSIIKDASGPLEYRRAFYRGDKYKFVVQRDLRSGDLA